MPEQAVWIIGRGGFSGRRRYWSGFKGEGRARPRSKWVQTSADAVRFVRQSDAQEIIIGLRLYRLSPKPMSVTIITD